jgi:DNA-binding transcriptional MocR family regulator
MGRSDVLAFWFGESDEPTPEFVREAAAASLSRGETFYAHNLGLPELAELREAVARYTSRLHPAVGAERIAVTSSGVSALMLAMRALAGAGAGAEVVAVVPVWPNLTAQPAILGAKVKRVSLRARGGWTPGRLAGLCAAACHAGGTRPGARRRVRRRGRGLAALVLRLQGPGAAHRGGGAVEAGVDGASAIIDGLCPARGRSS